MKTLISLLIAVSFLAWFWHFWCPAYTKGPHVKVSQQHELNPAVIHYAGAFHEK